MSYDENDRREIAARLRSKRPDEFELRYERTVLEHIFHSLFPKQVYPVSNWVLRMPYTLAGLIDRPTCKRVPMDATGCPPFYTGGLALNDVVGGCSECGYPFGNSNAIIGNPFNAPNYCPNCGARVVTDDD